MYALEDPLVSPDLLKTLMYPLGDHDLPEIDSLDYRTSLDLDLS